jgi:hypothetical protein
MDASMALHKASSGMSLDGSILQRSIRVIWALPVKPRCMARWTRLKNWLDKIAIHA